MTPTLANKFPRVGYLDPMADYEQIIDRLQEVRHVHAATQHHG